MPAAGTDAEKAQAAGAAPAPLPGRARAPAATPAGAAQMQGGELAGDPRDAALAAFISPRGAAASPGRTLGLSPADKELLAADRQRAEDLTSTVGDAARLHQEAVSGFRDQSQALLEDATVGRMLHEQGLAEDAKHRAAIEADYKQSQAKIGAKLDELSAQGVDPNHYWQSQSTAQKIGAAIAVAMGAFAAHPLGPRGEAGHNTALDIINGAIAADIDAQKTNLSHQLTVLGKRQDLAREGFDVNMAMLKAHRDSIESAYQVATRDVDRRMATFKDNADLQQKAAALKVGLAQTKEELIRPLQDQMYQVKKRAETVVPGAGPSTQVQERIVKRAQELADKAAEAGKEMSPADARRRAAAEILGVDVKPGEALPSYAKPQKDGKPGEKGQDQLNAFADAEEGIQQLIAMRKSHGGGTFSAEERAKAEALSADVRARMAHALGARVTPAELEAMQHNVPESPLEFTAGGIIGSDPTMARLQATYQRMRAHHARALQNPGAPDTSPEALGLEAD